MSDEHIQDKFVAEAKRRHSKPSIIIDWVALGADLKLERQKLGLSLVTAASLIGIPDYILGLTERGKHKLKDKYLGNLLLHYTILKGRK